MQPRRYINLCCIVLHLCLLYFFQQLSNRLLFWCGDVICDFRWLYIVLVSWSVSLIRASVVQVRYWQMTRQPGSNRRLSVYWKFCVKLHLTANCSPTQSQYVNVLSCSLPHTCCDAATVVKFAERCCHAMLLLAWHAVALCLSVSPSVTSYCYTDVADRRITERTLYNSQGTVVFWCQTSWWNSYGFTPTQVSDTRGVDKNRRFSTSILLWLKTGQDRDIVTIEG